MSEAPVSPGGSRRRARLLEGVPFALVLFVKASFVCSLAFCGLASAAGPRPESANPMGPSNQGTGGTPPPEPSAGSTLARLAAFVREVPAPVRSLVAVAPVREVGEARLSPEARTNLAREISAVVGAAVVGAPRRSNEPLSPEQARQEARSAGLALVLLEPHMNGGSVLLEVTVTQFAPTFWERSKHPAGTVTYHAQAEAPADTLLRRFLPPARGLLATLRQVPSPVQSPLALLCTDLRGDGGQQLLVIGRQELVVGRVAEREFLVEGRRSWEELSPVASAPLRAPLASAVRIASGVLVGSSDREHLVELDRDLNKRREAARAYPLKNGRCLPFSSRGLSSRELDCFASARSGSGNEFDAVSVGSVTESNGTSTRLLAQLALGTDRLDVEVHRTSESAHSLSVENVGHSSIWDDLDGDGQVELIVSSSGEPKGGEQLDRLRVFSLDGDELNLRVEKEAPPVHALTACPFSGSNPNLLVAAVGTDIWVLQ